MAKVSRETVQHVAGLARLRLSEEELVFYEGRMRQIISYFDQMDALSGKLGADWRADVQGDTTLERPDAVLPSADVEQVMRQAPQSVGTAFLVPKIIE